MNVVLKNHTPLFHIVDGHRDWKFLLREAAEIVRSYDTLVILRQLFYRLVASERLPNTINAYKALSRSTAEARRRETFPDLMDRGRSIHRLPFWGGIADALDWIARVYRKDRTIGQRYSIYLGIEKAGILEQIEAWFGEYGFPVLALGGYCPQSHVDEVKRHVANDGRPAVLLYAGDYDPSGVGILRDFRERTDCCWDQVRQVALTKEQVKTYRLPAAPGKDSDSRKQGFIDKYGEYVQVELDALRPEDLRELFEVEVANWWDESAYEAVIAREESERQTLQAQVKKWQRR